MDMIQFISIVFGFLGLIVLVRNYLKSRKASKFASELWKSEPGTKTMWNGVEVTRLPDKPKEESNLVKHARVELERIGEESSVIDWYAKVIQEYASFGHSGGSHAAIMPTLTTLLNYQPLAPLTNDPREWHHHESDVYGPNGIWQNNRDGRAFSEDGGETYYLVDDRNKSIHKSACNLCWDLEEAKCTGCGRNDYANLSGN